MKIVSKVKIAVTGGIKSLYAVQKQGYMIKHDALIKEILHCTENGVSSERLCENEVIVSLTTYGRRLYDVAVAIESIMQGTVKPNRIVLWLSEELKGEELPVTLEKQMKRGLEIEFCKDIRSYTKLIPCLRKYPEACIITIDDDLIYPYDLVERLVKAHKKFPKNIIANLVDRIKLDKNGKPISFRKWKKFDLGESASPLNVFIASNGVIYPPHCFHEEIFNEKVFLDICKYADDVWFHAMALMNGTFTRKCYTHSGTGYDVSENADVQDTALWRINNNPNNCMNDIQIKAVFDKYDLYKKLK